MSGVQVPLCPPKPLKNKGFQNILKNIAKKVTKHSIPATLVSVSNSPSKEKKMSNVENLNINVPSLDELRKTLIESGVEWAQELKPQNNNASRVETKRGWMVDGREATDEEIDLFQEMPFILGSSVSFVEPRELSQSEVDDIAYELTSVNKTKDMLEGRVAKIRSTVFEAFNFMSEQDGSADAINTPGTFVSEKYGVKLCREITGGKPFVDMNLAREVLGDRFDKIVNRSETIKVVYGPDGQAISEETNVEYEINEKALETQVALGNITLDDLAKITATTKKVAKFITRKI